MSQLPNIVTVLRLILVAPVTYCLVEDLWLEAFVVLLVAGVSDTIDGALARKFGWTSKFGEIADPLADKLTFGMVVLILAIKGILPLWVMLIVIGRDVVISLGMVACRIILRPVSIEPTFASKVSTTIQIVVLLLLVLSMQDLVVSEWIQIFLDPYAYTIVAVFALGSGIQYFYVWILRAREEWPERFPRTKISNKTEVSS